MMTESSDALVSAESNITELRAIDVTDITSQINAMTTNVHDGINNLLRSKEATDNIADYRGTLPTGYTNHAAAVGPPAVPEFYSMDGLTAGTGNEATRRNEIADRVEVALASTNLPVRSKIATLFNREFAKVKTRSAEQKNEQRSLKDAYLATDTFLGTDLSVGPARPTTLAADVINATTDARYSKMHQSFIRGTANAFNTILSSNNAEDDQTHLETILGATPISPWELDGGHYKITIPDGELSPSDQQDYMEDLAEFTRSCLKTYTPALKIRDSIQSTFSSATTDLKARRKKGPRPVVRVAGFELPNLRDPHAWRDAFFGQPDEGYGDDEDDRMTTMDTARKAVTDMRGSNLSARYTAAKGDTVGAAFGKFGMRNLVLRPFGWARTLLGKGKTEAKSAGRGIWDLLRWRKS